jgi:hypothetical protein
MSGRLPSIEEIPDEDHKQAINPLPASGALLLQEAPVNNSPLHSETHDHIVSHAASGKFQFSIFQVGSLITSLQLLYFHPPGMYRTNVKNE